MSENYFIRQVATKDILSNVANFCSECYTPISYNDTIFYDMTSYRYLCQKCKNEIEERVDSNCNFIDAKPDSLFNL
ncbi:MAG: hypothetical protein GXO60_09085 [Epsilonproteobacteria bacterium]|nr:hypothetical protein [Campylobacterota bacterium]